MISDGVATSGSEPKGSHDDELQRLPYPLEKLEKDVASVGSEKRAPLAATGSYEVEMSVAVITLELRGHASKIGKLVESVCDVSRSHTRRSLGFAS